MIYRALKTPLLEWLRAPSGPPDAPFGSPSSVQIFRASPRFLHLRLFLHVISLLPAIAIELIFLLAERAVSLHTAATLASFVVLVLTVVVGICRYFLIRLDYDMRYYVVTDFGIRIRQGALTIQESTFTFANVQNLTIRQGPLERLFGIASLSIETAGGGSASPGEHSAALPHHGVLAGIANANELRDRVVALVRAYRDAGLGDREDPRKPESLPRSRSRAWSERLREILAELRALKAALDR